MEECENYLKKLSSIIRLGVPGWARYSTFKYSVWVGTIDKDRSWSSRHLGEGHSRQRAQTG